ncbi:MAG: DUF6746 family protein [Hydrogenophilus thermoluteolus]
MKNRVFAAVLGMSLALGSFALTAAEPQGRTAHREVSIPTTASAAWEILRQDGAELKRYLEKETLTPMDLHEIHMLSYSLEVAVHRLRSEWEQIANDLEEMHQNSESGNAEKTRQHGQAFLDAVSRVQGCKE